MRHAIRSFRYVFREARQAFTAALEAMPDDGPTMTMLKRIDAARYADARKRFEASGATIDRETKAARELP